MRMAGEKSRQESFVALELIAREAISAVNVPAPIQSADSPEQIPAPEQQPYQDWVKEDDHEWTDYTFPGAREDVALIPPGMGIPGIGLSDRNFAGEEYDG